MTQGKQKMRDGRNKSKCNINHNKYKWIKIIKGRHNSIGLLKKFELCAIYKIFKM